MADPPYGPIRTLVERLGGSMVYEREGYRYGAWVIRLGEQCLLVEAHGEQSFPALDKLYGPPVLQPRHWDDYNGVLVPEAKRRLLALLGIPPEDASGLAPLIERTKWRFAWTYARTYPHEYTTLKFCRADDHAWLIDCIEQQGVLERFGNSQRKYLHFEERKYWHMGDPSSADPEQWPNVINRTWVDVRRHAANVAHVWTPEEVELQQRIWEIQLEKVTDHPKSEATPKVSEPGPTPQAL